MNDFWFWYFFCGIITAMVATVLLAVYDGWGHSKIKCVEIVLTVVFIWPLMLVLMIYDLALFVRKKIRKAMR